MPLAIVQFNAMVDAGRTHVNFGEDDGAAAVLLAPSARIDGRAFTVNAGGSVARFGETWSAQTAITSSYYTSMIGPLRAEAETSFDAAMQPDVQGTGAGRAGLRLHLPRDTRGLWLGAHTGRASDGRTWRSTLAGEAGLWIQRDRATALVQISPTILGDTWRYTDAFAAGRMEYGSLEMSVSVGVRAWSRPSSAPATAWAGINGAFWFGNHFAMTAAGGSYPADLGQGFGAGRYISVGLRVAMHRPSVREAVSNVIRRTLPPAAQPIVERFRAYRGEETGWTIEVAAPGANQVELMANFTGWKAVALGRRGAGQWSVTLPIAPGTHRLNLRVNGGAWGVPPGLPVVLDEFNGAVALLTVE